MLEDQICRGPRSFLRLHAAGLIRTWLCTLSICYYLSDEHLLPLLPFLQGAPHEIKEHTALNLAKQSTETRGNLGQHLDLYQIHSATLDSGVLEAEDVLQLLGQLKQGGAVSKGWKIGLSLSGGHMLAFGLEETDMCPCSDVLSVP